MMIKGALLDTYKWECGLEVLKFLNDEIKKDLRS